MRIGLLGGSFDPVHFGHLLLAQDAYEQHGLDRLILIPAAQAALKETQTAIPPDHRLGMVRAAVEEDERFEVSDWEILRGGISYTIDTVRHFREAYPSSQLFWVLGADQVAKLPLWKNIDELAKLTEFIFLERPGHPAPRVAPLPNLKLHRCGGRQFEVSSTEVRERIRQGRPINYFVPHKTIAYIEEHALYR